MKQVRSCYGCQEQPQTAVYPSPYSVKTVTIQTASLISHIPDTPIEITTLLKATWLNIIIQLLFNIEPPEGQTTYVEATNFIELCIANQTRFVPELSLSPETYHRYQAAQTTQQQYAQAILTAKKQQTATKLGTWWEKMDKETLLTAVTRTLLNGYNALAGATGWTLYLLSQNKAIQKKLHQEIDHVLANKPPTTQELPHLTYTRSVIQETMRLYPPAWILGRTAQEVDQLGQYPISPGTIISVSPYTMHRASHCWQAPANFNPNRFNHNTSQQRPPFAYFPFGGGSRLCPAAHISVQAIQLMLTMIMQRFTIQHVSNKPVKACGLISLRPEPGLILQCTTRNG